MTSLNRRAFAALSLSTLAVGRANAGPAPDVVVPLQIWDGMPIVQATLNGKGPYPFLVGTGHQYGMIDEALAHEIGLEGPMSSRSRFITEAGGASPTFYRAEQMVLGGTWALPKVELMLKDLSSKTIKGVFPFVARGMTSFDFDKPEMRYHPGHASLPPEAVKVTLMQRSGGRRSPPMLHGRLDGEQVAMSVNTSTWQGLSFTPDAVKRLGLWDRFPDAETTTTSVNGRRYDVRYVRGGTFEFAGASFALPPIRMATPELAGVEFFEWDGEIGMDLLRRFRILFAPDRDSGWFGPNQHLGDPYGRPEDD